MRSKLYKILVILVLFLSVTCFVGCGGKKPDKGYISRDDVTNSIVSNFKNETIYTKDKQQDQALADKTVQQCHKAKSSSTFFALLPWQSQNENCVLTVQKTTKKKTFSYITSLYINSVLQIL